MARSRKSLEEFTVARDAYIGARVTVYEANPDGTASATKATLYSDLTGVTTLLNPQDLNSNGQWAQPIYVDVDYVISVSGGAATGESGAVQYGGSARGTYVTATRYWTHDTILGPAGQVPDIQHNIYQSNTIFVSTTWAVDVANLTLELDYQAAVANVPFATRANINAAVANKAMPPDQFLTSKFDATGKHLIPLGAGSLVPDTSTVGGGPAFSSNLTATNKVPFRSLDFDAATQENAGCKITGPKSADETVAVLAIIRWTANGGTIAQGVVWGLSVTGTGDGDDLDVSYTAAVKVTDALIGATYKEHVTAITANITVKNWAANDSLNILVSRFPGDAGDTLTVDAKLTSIDFFLVTDQANDV